ncbi:MAG: 3'-5' exonuclease, partial [Angelakisella sp.]
AAEYGNGADLSGFLGYLYSLEEYEKDLPAAATASGNAVSVMSIHKSKGLEFPVVFLCDTATKFNTTDLTCDLQLHPELGFACVLRDNRRMVQHRTVQLAAMVLENRRAMLSEELRVLYVALTRARERLYITASDPKLSHLRRAAQSPLQQNGKASPWAVRSAGCVFDWIATALCRHPDFDQTLLAVPATVPQGTTASSQGRLCVRLVTAALTHPTRPQTGGGEPVLPACDPAEVAALRCRMHWEYPYMADTLTPVKLSVSQLTKAETHRQFALTRRPLLLTQKSLTPAERGVAAHRYMQFADYHAAAVDPQAELERLVSHGFLTAEEGRFIDLATIRTLFASPLGQRIANADEIHREIRFMREFTPEELEQLLPGSGLAGNTVVQGVADCVIVENGRGTILDYKTDMVPEIAVLAARYAGQLRLYQYILEELLELTIDQRILYSFPLGEQIST